jgi:hypothetical protein
MTVSPLRSRLLWLTLLAFGVQIAVADFHHHTSRATGIQSRAMTAGMCSPSHAHPCGPLDKGHDGCALCWATAIAATSLTPILFVLSPPSETIGRRLKAFDIHQGQVMPLAEVRARGPPTTALG